MQFGMRSEADRLQFFLKAWQALPPTVEVPIDTRAPDPRQPARTWETAEFSQGQWPQVVQVSSALGVEPALFVFAALHVLLHRYTGQESVWTGWQPRQDEEAESLLPVCSELPISGGAEGPLSFQSLLFRLRDQLTLSAEYAPVPWAALGRQLGSVADARSLLSVFFSVRHPSPNGSTADRRAMASALPPPVWPALHVTLQADADDSTARLTLLDTAGARQPATLQRMLGHLLEVLGAAATSPGAPAATLPLLTAAEHAQRSAWNQTAYPFPEHQCVHHLFEAQVARTPDSVALVFEEERLTYAQLDARANQLAARLRQLGAGPGVLIGLFLERSIEMAVAVLAVLKAGSAYVPLDPAYPRERLEFLCTDTQTPILLTQHPLRPLTPGAAAQIVCIDRDQAETPSPAVGTGSAGADLARPEADSSDLAYVIYTSGSTGKPKGICLSHRALVNLIAWHGRTLLGGARTLQFASLSFDASFHELFAAWHTGGSVYLISEALRRDVHALSRFIEREAIEKVILPVVVLQQLAEHHRDEVSGLRSLRELTTTGEQLHITPAIVQLFERLPHCRLHNHYGPSETHVVTALQLPRDPRLWPSHPSIGRPIDNCTTYILDRYSQPAPVGVVGELYLGGVCLADGYLRRPSLTTERFLTGLPQAGVSERLYRTGDLARYRTDGCIDFLGRSDHQIKLRGFRIEPAEIEGQLTAHQDVAEALAVVREDVPGDRRLVAYVVPQPSAALNRTVLRTYLHARLPAFMVPGNIVIVPRLPLNANGKVDRRALPAPGQERPELDIEYVAPRGEVQLQLAEIFSDTLHIDGVGANDSLIALGGDSLRAMRILARVRQKWGVALPFDKLLAAPTVAAIAAMVEERLAPRAGHSGALSDEAGITPLEPSARRGAALSSAQERMWFLHKLQPNSPLQACFYAFRLRGSLQVEALSSSLQQLVARHEVLRTNFPDHGGEPRALVLRERSIPIEQTDLASLPVRDRESALRQCLRAEAARPFDLASGPLVRMGIIRESAEECVLWWRLHHIITDGRSMEVLFRELSEIYKQQLTGSDALARREPALQYLDYAAWERRHQSEAALAQHVEFWRNKLAGVPHQIALPTDHPRPAVQSHRA